MYRELARFLVHIGKQRSLWTDGELWTALAGGVVGGMWFYAAPDMIPTIRKHFGSLLTTSGIILGFVLSVLSFYVQAIAAWSRDAKVQAVAKNLIDWHVWTIVCLLTLITYVLTLWAFGPRLQHGLRLQAVEYGILAFLVLYCVFQILNHSLTVWWTFTNSDRLRVSTTPDAR